MTGREWIPPAGMPPRVYPLPQVPVYTDRFTFGLTLDVADVLAQHGYPQIHGADLAALRACLSRFLFTDNR